ncbi:MULTISPECIES: hypothetical protein [unclassified Sporosarcina]|uniref:hypothetical protein n=1 Tax=unclassified Sporosarcina TaxID=2647733 RepID=UPI0020424F8C|nr:MULTISPECIES: hypothetical protein [unclassified Sporosarcina]GKV64989.1 hypothetical protein NCCP2331_11420 [Sporosarcina sp. NCCP-2331]GLB56624.1 hypothetical protein NCCP2378_24110 [Sporosarcina sp. NCCP-2378]
MKKRMIIALTLLLAGCSGGQLSNPLPSPLNSAIDWVDFVKWNDTTYSANFETNERNLDWETGEEIGKVKYMLNGHAGANHKSKNGDAAYLPKGTQLYEIKGYDPAFRIFADGKVYEVSDAGNFGTIGDFLDIEGKVKRVILQSEEDLSLVGEFSEEHAAEFIKELLTLPYKEEYELFEGKRVFFGIELEDGSMTRSLYWPATGYITYGGKASGRMKEIFEEEMNVADY